MTPDLKARLIERFSWTSPCRAVRSYITTLFTATSALLLHHAPSSALSWSFTVEAVVVGTSLILSSLIGVLLDRVRWRRSSKTDRAMMAGLRSERFPDFSWGFTAHRVRVTLALPPFPGR
jgi:hypothetical protein